MTAPVEATPVNDGSLDRASKAIAGLLSVKPEDPQPAKTPPEQSPTETASETEQAPAEPSPEAIEPAKSVVAEDQNEPAPQPRKIKVSDEIGEVTEEELTKGYLRQADYTRKTQAVAEEKRAFEEKEAAAVRAQRQQYDHLLRELETALTDLSPAEPDWEKRKSETTPEQLNAELLAWQAQKKRIDQVKAERERVSGEQAEDAKRGFANYVELERAKLMDALPDMKDATKGKTLMGQLVTHAKSYGFTDDQLAQVVDHRIVLLLHDAMRFKAQKAKAPEIKNKIEKAMETSAPGSRTSTQQTDKLKEAKERLRKSHSVDDGAHAIAALLEKEAAPTRR